MVQTAVLQGIRSLFFPTACLGCNLPLADSGAPLCWACSPQLPISRPPWCRRCGRSLYGLGAGVTACLSCRTSRPFFDQAASPLLYEGLAKELIALFKYDGELRLAPFLTQLLLSAVQRRFGENPADLVVPVPLYPTRLRERTFNQAEVLARGLAKAMGLRCETHLMKRRKFTLPQTQLIRKERAANVKGAFLLNPLVPIENLRILLVDDVFTTGATTNACAKALKQAGASQVNIVAIAHG